MIDATNILKFLHVLSAAIWVGGGFMLQMLLWRARRLGPEASAEFNKAAEWTSQHVFMPTSFATLAFGIAVTVVGPWSFSELWITLGFVGFAISAINGMAVLGPTAKKMKALVEERGPNDPVAAHMARRLDLFGRLDLVVLIAVVFIMIVKP
jgi:uncharacterized membrane protein